MAKFDPIRNFPFWCHKIIPLVYDDSLSYYEFLCKVMQKLNEAIDLLNAHSEEIEKFETDLMALFEAFREEIRQKIADFETMFVEEYDPTVLYAEGDIRSKDGKLYRALTDTTGEFNSEDWLEIIFATDFGEWRKSLNERVIQFMLDVTTKLDNWTSSIASTYDEDTNYSAGDIISHEDQLYIANKNTTGTFEPNDWDSIVLVNWLRDIIRRYDQAIDSVTETADDCEKRKVAITSSHIVNRNILYRTHTDPSSTGYIPFEYNVGPETNITVYVLTLVNASPSAVSAFRDSVDKMAIGTAPSFNTTAEKDLNWIGDSAYVAFPAYSGNNLVVSLHLTTAISVGIQYKVMKYTVDGLGNNSLPNASTEGAGYVNANDMFRYLMGADSALNTAMQELSGHVTNVLVNIGRLYNEKSDRNLPSTFGGYADEWERDTNTVTGGSYYYHTIYDGAFLNGYFNLVLLGTNTVAFVGVGTSPDDGLQHQYAVREIVTRYGRKAYVLTDLPQLATNEKLYVYYLAADIDPTIGSSGVYKFYLEDSPIDGTVAGYFSALPVGIIADWLDGRVSANETQLGGFSLRKVTQSEYDALVTKDPNTWYAIVG